ncbi:hypothetical protein ABOZ73_15695 [Caulobacter sp. 73W]|uniref:N-acetyltransferase domain-containing protein n=1 Tax=Caulobacter sp. 73W TaxID=3161137 RepID=A0AB39KRC5_9CAUL
MGTNGLGTSDNARTVEILDRRIAAHRSVLQLSDGGQIEVRRFFPAGKGDRLRISNTGIDVFLRHDGCWLPLEPAWRWSATLPLGVEKINLTFKEIETPEEMAQFESLRRFHYRGGGGAGRTVPILASGDLWDLPSVLGFIEVSSSMIANTARKKFFSTPYREPNGLHWQEWDTATSKRYSSAISRISRFVIHPEIRGLGIAKHFMEAAREYSRDRWHYGGMRPRFLEITADMLKYYKFVDQAFAFMGETEGNEHRVAKDMTYLVKKAKNLEDGMPQGGGGIMTLQRGYASQLMRYLEKNERPLPEVVASLRNDPSMLDQDAWESLHRLNRRPKPSYVSGLSESAAEYVDRRRRSHVPQSYLRQNDDAKVLRAERCLDRCKC